MIKVFLSAVFTGLKRERSQLIEQLESTGLYEVIAMERFGANTRPPLDVCLRELNQADVVVLLLGPRYGSRLPDQQISYTHAEYRHAVEHRIDVLSFVLREDKALCILDVKALNAFKSEVEPRHTHQRTTKRNLIRDVQQSLTDARERGEIGRRLGPFQKLERFFEKELRIEGSPILHHTGPFFGRDDELGRVANFLRSDTPAMVVRGAGGLGKSRLILEAVKAMDQAGVDRPAVLFMRGESSFDLRDISLLPTMPLVLCIDDAHRMGDLESLLKACRDHNSAARVLCTCRSSAADTLTGSLDRALDPVGEIQFVDVWPMNKKEAEGFARHALGQPFAHLAEELVRVADSNPLIIRVGAACIVEKLVVPQMLASNPSQFRSLALDQLLKDPAVSSIDHEIRRRLLSLVSAIGPIQPSDGLVYRMGQFLGFTSDAVRHAIDALELSGFLRRRRNTLRVTPDVLADHMLQTEAVTKLGKSSGYIDRAMKSFGNDHLGNILLNAAELDWRNQDAGDRVLRATWRSLQERVRDSSSSEKHALLSLLKPPAAFMPGEVLDLLEICLGHTDAGNQDWDAMLGEGSSQGIVLDSCIELLGLIATHPDFTTRCLSHLHKLALSSSGVCPTTQSKARERIKGLAEFNRWRREMIQQAAVPWIVERLNAQADSDDAVWLIEVLGEALKREVKISDSDGKTISWGYAPIAGYFDSIKRTRESVVATLNEIALASPDHRTAYTAIETLGKLLQKPSGSIRRVVDDQEIKVWATEAAVALTHLIDAAKTAASSIARQHARNMVLDYADSPWIDAAPSTQQIRQSIRALPRDPIWESLSGHLPRALNYRYRKRYLDALRKRASTVLANSGLTIEELVAKVRHIYDTGHWLSGFWQFGSLLRQVISKRPDDAVAIADGLLADDAFGDRYCADIIEALRAAGHPADAKRIAVSSAQASRDVRRASSVSAIAGLAHADVEFVTTAWTWIERLAEDESPVVRTQVASVLLRYECFGDELAVALITQIEWAGDVAVARAVLEAIDMRFYRESDLLPDDAARSLLEKLATLSNLLSCGEWVQPTLKILCRSMPAETLRMLVQRAARPKTEDGWDPFPHIDDLGLGSHLDKAVALDCLRVIRDAFLDLDPREHWRLHSCFKAACWNDECAVQVLDEWLSAMDPHRVRAIGSMISSLEFEFVYEQHEFVARLLEAAASVGDDSLQNVKWSLVRCGSSGARSKAATDPVFPRDESDRERAETLAGQYKSFPLSHSLYTQLMQDAESNIEQSKRDFADEEDD